MVFLKSGRFGPYVETTPPGEEKPKRSSLPKDWAPDTISLERAVKLLSLPRTVGAHPEDGEPILANLGRYGPYVQHHRTFANLPGIEDVFEVGLNRAVTLIAEKQASRGARGAAKVLKDLGAHPEDEQPIQVLEGRYGPYVKHGKINATLPKNLAPEDVNVDQALELLAEKAAKKGAKKKTTRKKKPAAKKS